MVCSNDFERDCAGERFQLFGRKYNCSASLPNFLTDLVVFNRWFRALFDVVSGMLIHKLIKLWPVGCIGCEQFDQTFRQCFIFTTNLVYEFRPRVEAFQLDGPAEDAYFVFSRVQGAAVGSADVKSFAETSVTVSGARVITENSGWLHAFRLNVLQFFPILNAVQDRDCLPRCLQLASNSRAHGL